MSEAQVSSGFLDIMKTFMECFANVRGFIVPSWHPQQALLVLYRERKGLEVGKV